MDIFKALNEKSEYSDTALQFILGAWVVAGAFEGRKKVDLAHGDVAEEDYDKQSIYSLLYALYRTVGEVRSDTGATYELTFNTWGYDWPEALGPCPVDADDPQRFGKYAYTGLFAFPEVQRYVAERDGAVHVVELGCGTGAGAHHVCKHVLPQCTYEAVDMQLAAIRTAQRRFVPELGGRLRATHADATQLADRAASADLVAVCETHVTEMAGRVTDEDRRFFATVERLLKPGGYLVWGNAIPASTWQPCFDHLESIGLRLVASRDVTREAVRARDLDQGRVDAYVRQSIERFAGFRIPLLGGRRRREAELAMRNFYRDPGTNMYRTLADGTDAYRVVAFQKAG